ncbi:hypothetical protein [Methanobacterium formicicum]|uniref:Uncharacterized protein n=1 Tax=Methanobacterium formicicum TaxID=2162 RepID=A0A090I1S9_METFO|nr:hypothetical protein [Methanobacterium formicicum]MDH2659763.1 hypothetical protein [Methanobacterium formicicum]CEA12794.1 hypothetical protein DSM1535_0432 [Methanobacterium formicicum]
MGSGGGFIGTKSEVIDDLIILGRACPEKIRDGRITVCTAGYSETSGFIRVYPTHLYMPWHQWDIVSVPVEQNPYDNRTESWKIKGSKHEWDSLHKKIDIVGNFKEKHRLDFLHNLVDGCVKGINDDKRSLGIIKPTINNVFFAEQKNYDSTTQIDLSGLEQTKVKDQYPNQPRIKYNCSDCKATNNHDQQVLEWGFYEWMRKNPGNIEQVWDNARISDSEYEKFFFIGNHFRYRSSFFIISVLRVKKKGIQKSLIPFKKI